MTPSAEKQAGFIVSPAYDLFFFILSPLLGLALGAAASFTPLAAQNYERFGRPESFLAVFSSIFTMAHLVIVFFRSHLNPSIFKLYRARFVAVPLLLFGAMALSSWMLVFGFVLAVWWDVYHSSLQTFGLGRLYDRRAGSDVETGRGYERALSLLLYAGPIFAGATFWDHAIHFKKFSDVGSPQFADWFFWYEPRRPAVSAAIVVIAALFLAYGAFRRFRGPRRLPWQKAVLYGSTAVTAAWAWGFNSFGEAFFIMNFFHALQYFAIVWWAERGRLSERFGPFALAALVGGGFGYGIWATFRGESNHYAFSLLLTVSLLHFWYDGFIWSVRRGQVR